MDDEQPRHGHETYAGYVALSTEQCRCPSSPQPEGTESQADGSSLRVVWRGWW
jgi:hypothetical protein